MNLDAADRALLMGAYLFRYPMYQRDNLCRSQCGVLPQMHRSRPCVPRSALDGYFCPGEARDAFHNTDCDLFVFQYRTLLDVQLQICMWLEPTRLCRPGVPDAFQLLLDGPSIDPTNPIRVC